MRITQQTAKEKIESCKGIFTVVFIKRTTGEERTMTCRQGVKKYIKSSAIKGPVPYDPSEHNLVWVFDLGLFREQTNPEMSEEEKEEIGQGCYRSINLEQIISIKIDGKEYTVNDFPLQNWKCEWKDAGTDCSRVVRARTEEEAKMVLKREERLKVFRGRIISLGPVSGAQVTA
jgi:hypothetical protein